MTRSVPSRKASPSPMVRRTSDRNRARWVGLQVADRGAEEGQQPPGVPGQLTEVLLEVSDHRLDLQGGEPLGHRRARVLQHSRIDVERHEAPERARLRQRSDQQLRLLRGAAAELDEGLGTAGARDVDDVPVEDRALGPGGVVLLEPGDLVEELAAPGVVEVLRRQRLRIGGESGSHVDRHLRRQRARVEVDLGVQDRHQLSRGVTVTSLVSRRPTSSRCRSGTSTHRASSS